MCVLAELGTADSPFVLPTCGPIPVKFGFPMTSSDSSSPAGETGSSHTPSISTASAQATAPATESAAGTQSAAAVHPPDTGSAVTTGGGNPAEDIAGADLQLDGGESSESQPRSGPPRIRIGSQRPGAKPPAAQARPVLQPPPEIRSSTVTQPVASEGGSPASATVAGETISSPAAPNTPPAAAGADPPPAAKPFAKKPALKVPRADVPPGPAKKIQPPNVRAALPADLELEMAAALGDMPLDDLLGNQAGSREVAAEFEPEARVTGRVLSAFRDSVFVDLGGRRQGALKIINLESVPEPGSLVDVVVARFNAEDGLYELALPGGAVAVEDWSQVTEGMVVEARVTGHNTGGLECEVSHLQGFIPASQISLYRVEDLSQFVGQKFPCVVTDVKPERRRLVLSHRAVLEREKAAAREKLLAELEPGQVREGTVRSLRDFGAFVDLGGIDGLIHVSQLSWDRIKHANEVLQEGQKVKVKIQKIDPETGKIGLAFRDLSENPWTGATSRYPARSKVKGTVSRITEFGAFVKLEPGIEGLIHISELSHKRVWRVEDIVQEGQEVEVLVQSIDPEQQRISLSLKALEARPTTAKKEDEQVQEEAPLAAPPKKSKPLKGGIGSSSGGEKFGLKW